MSTWIEFVKSIQKEKGCTFSQAMVIGSPIWKQRKKGDGLQDFLKNPIKETKRVANETTERISTAIKGRDTLPPKSRAILAKYGDFKIIEMNVGRNPLSSLIPTIGDKISNGEISKFLSKYSYDSLFHLFLNMKLENGQLIKTEKNQVISISTGNYAMKESINVSVTKSVTLNELISNGEQYAGSKRFLHYDAFNANCQDYVLSLLKGSGLGSANVFEFVKQNTNELVKQLPGFAAPVLKGVTDLAAGADVLLKGKGKGRK